MRRSPPRPAAHPPPHLEHTDIAVAVDFVAGRVAHAALAHVAQHLAAALEEVQAELAEEQLLAVLELGRERGEVPSVHLVATQLNGLDVLDLEARRGKAGGVRVICAKEMWATNRPNDGACYLHTMQIFSAHYSHPLSGRILFGVRGAAVPCPTSEHGHTFVNSSCSRNALGSKSACSLSLSCSSAATFFFWPFLQRGKGGYKRGRAVTQPGLWGACSADSLPGTSQPETNGFQGLSVLCCPILTPRPTYHAVRTSMNGSTRLATREMLNANATGGCFPAIAQHRCFPLDDPKSRYSAPTTACALRAACQRRDTVC